MGRNSKKPLMENFVLCAVQVLGDKAKGRILKRVFQENKARQIFRRTNISNPLIHTHTCAYQGVRNVRFSKNLMCFVFLQHPFWDLPFRLITDEVVGKNERFFVSHVYITWSKMLMIEMPKNYLLYIPIGPSPVQSPIKSRFYCLTND